VKLEVDVIGRKFGVVFQFSGCTTGTRIRLMVVGLGWGGSTERFVVLERGLCASDNSHGLGVASERQVPMPPLALLPWLVPLGIARGKRLDSVSPVTVN
jgi:hypothetical protein